MNLPKARSRNIVVQTLGDETLIYDLDSHKAFNLNASLSIIFNHCDGKTSVAQVKERYQFSDDVINFALGELQTAKLLDGENLVPSAGLSRRQAIRKIGLASLVAIPLLTTLSAPTAVQAASQPTTCDSNPCTCSVTNPNPEFRVPCIALGGVSTGCADNIPGCTCCINPNSDVGTCEIIFD